MPLKSTSNKALDRLNNAVNILIKYGFQSILVKTGLVTRKVTQRNFPDIDPSLNKWQRMRLATQDLGPTAVRLAQYLALRPDILPDELISEFAHLEFPKLTITKAEAESIFEKFTHRAAAKTFQYFDNQSTLQDGFTATFRAKLLTGEDVAVKILPPDTQSVVLADIALFKRLASLTSGVLEKLGVNNPVALIEDFERTILPELDLSKEADKMRRFTKAYKGLSSFVVPELFPQYTSTNSLVTYYYNSTSVANASEFVAWGLQQKAVADRFLSIFISGMLDTGLFLATPLKEIIRVLPDGRIHFADYGTAGLLTSDQRVWINDVVAALSTRNSMVLADSMRKLSYNSEVYDFQLFRNDIQSLADNLYFMESTDYYMREFAMGIMRIAYKHKLLIPAEVVSAFNALAIAENITLSITPTSRIAEFFKTYGNRLLRDRMQPDRFKTLFNKNMTQVSDFLEVSPLELSLILKKLRRGEFVANLSIKESPTFFRRIDISVNKLCYVIIIAVLIISATLIMVFGQNLYMFMGIPLASGIAYALALIMALWLLIYNARTRYNSEK
ncbi:MAG: AarF/ABC1/UbiB kinase family protein [Bacteroidales bacterium]|nr:AarF/ABC1/UbiB kinase family protein [Bacteroidales bacterium]MBQ5575892.1 AarF/ABC1/UbiB kinase family protein [Bacteroidales bacterium]